MATQTNYSERMGLPSPGSIHGSDYDSATGICETASPGIGFGLAVSHGTLSDQGVVLGGTLNGFRGVSIRDATLRSDRGDIDKYVPPNSVGVLVRGMIWTNPGEAVAANDPVFFNGTTGVFMKSNSGGALGPVMGARWETSCDVNGSAVLKLSGYARNA